MNIPIRSSLFVRVFLLALVVGGCFALCPPATAAAAPWYPVKVLADGKAANYSPLSNVSRHWRVCVLLPHGQDRFWWGVSWGIAEDADRLNLQLGIYQAGGYGNLAEQRDQFSKCVALHADAILLSAVEPDGLNDLIAAAMRNKVVVVDMINGLKHAEVSAHSGGLTEQLAEMSAGFILTDAGKQHLTVAWFPGPKGADWVNKAEQGMRSVFWPGRVDVIDGGYDLTEPTRQMTLTRSVFASQAPDYVLANAVAAVDAARYVGAHPGLRTKVVAWYANEPVVEMIRNGQILAGGCNYPVLQARIALDLALRALERKPHPLDVKVRSTMIDSANVATFPTDGLYAPPGVWLIQRALPEIH